MGSMNQVIKGMEILGKYENPDDICGVCSEHDIIYAGGEDIQVSDEDQASLRELGWHLSDVGWAKYT